MKRLQRTELGMQDRRRWLKVGAGSVLAAGGVLGDALAQFRVQVSGIGATQLPITIAKFEGEEMSPQPISEIIQADLTRSGMFKGVSAADLKLNEASAPNLEALRQRVVDALVAGSVLRLADGRFDVRFRLWDVVKGQDLGARNYTVVAADLRLAAHRISDFVYEKLTGEKGVFSTRICYVTKNGGLYTLWVADSDGQSAKAALSSRESIISPSWSPTGSHLVYVSFESKKPVIYTQQVLSGARQLVANFRGSNSAPAWSPDGRTLAMTLTRDGGSQIHLMASTGGEPRRITQTTGIETESTFAPNGQSIYFTSDRGGGPQIYRMSTTGAGVERVTFNGMYNISPAISPDGRILAYISRVGNAYKLHVMDLGSGKVSAITDTWSDERPSFAPNSKLIIYATRIQGQEALMTTTVDGQIKARLAGVAGDIREPSWGPWIR